MRHGRRSWKAILLTAVLLPPALIALPALPAEPNIATESTTTKFHYRDTGSWARIWAITFDNATKCTITIRDHGQGNSQIVGLMPNLSAERSPAFAHKFVETRGYRAMVWHGRDMQAVVQDDESGMTTTGTLRLQAGGLSGTFGLITGFEEWVDPENAWAEVGIACGQPFYIAEVTAAGYDYAEYRDFEGGGGTGAVVRYPFAAMATTNHTFTREYAGDGFMAFMTESLSPARAVRSGLQTPASYQEHVAPLDGVTGHGNAYLYSGMPAGAFGIASVEGVDPAGFLHVWSMEWPAGALEEARARMS